MGPLSGKIKSPKIKTRYDFIKEHDLLTKESIKMGANNFSEWLSIVMSFATANEQIDLTEHEEGFIVSHPEVSIWSSPQEYALVKDALIYFKMEIHYFDRFDFESLISFIQQRKERGLKLPYILLSPSGYSFIRNRLFQLGLSEFKDFVFIPIPNSKAIDYAAQAALTGKKIIIFGTGLSYLETLKPMMDMAGLKADYAIDNDSNKEGKTIGDLVVRKPPTELTEKEKDGQFIIVASLFYPAIKIQLEQLGLKEYIHFTRGV